MLPSVRGLDHVAFGASDLEAARRGLERLGFRTTPRGECRWPLPEARFRAASASVVHPETYLDVIEIRDARWPPAAARATAGPGGLAPTGIVLGVAALDAALAALRARGGDAGTPYEIERTLRGAPDMLYRIARLEPEVRALPALLAIEDRAPGALRAAAWLRHPNGARALTRVTVSVPDLAPAQRLAEVLGLPVAVTRDPDGLGVRTGTAELRFALAPDQEHPRLGGLRFPCAELAAARRSLAEGGVPFAEPAPGVLRVPPEQGCGCAVELADG